MNPDFEALLAFAPPVLGEKAAAAPDPTTAGPGVASPVSRLREAKERSDRGDMVGKNRILADMVAADPRAFTVDSPGEKYPGLTHTGTGFQIHAHPGVAAQVADDTLIDMLRLNSTIQAGQDDRYKLAAVEKVAHYKQVCRECDKVIVRCRCPGPVTDLSYGLCKACGGPQKTAAVEDAPVTVCVDFDGTLAKIQKPFDAKTAGRPRRRIVALVRLLKEKGCRIIIWTVRGDSRLLKRWLKKYHVPYDFINENPDQPPNSSGKLYADVYLDDKAVNAEDATAATREVLERVAPLLAEREQVDG